MGKAFDAFLRKMQKKKRPNGAIYEKLFLTSTPEKWYNKSLIEIKLFFPITTIIIA